MLKENLEQVNIEHGARCSCKANVEFLRVLLWVPFDWTKDTVAANEEDDKVDADDHPGKDGAAVRHDAVVHHHVPVLACQDLRHEVRLSVTHTAILLGGGGGVNGPVQWFRDYYSRVADRL